MHLRMRMKTGWFRDFSPWPAMLVRGVALAVVVTGCAPTSENDDEGVPDEQSLALETDAPAVAYIGGVKYNRIGKARFEQLTADENLALMHDSHGPSVEEFSDGRRVETYPPKPHQQKELRDLSVEEIATTLRSRAVHSSGYEYLEAELPIALAKRLKKDLEARAAPVETPANLMGRELGGDSGQTDEGRQGRYIIGADNRVRMPAGSNPWQVAGMFGSVLSCSATMISSKVAVTAAHAVWKASTGAWIIPTDWVPSANSVAPKAPYGKLTWTWVRIPNTASTGAGNDYAYIEFSNSAAKNLGWLGTSTAGASWGPYWIVGYPGDKPFAQLWSKSANATAIRSTRIDHLVDIVPGDSGSALYEFGGIVKGIQSTQNWSQTCFAWVCGDRQYWNEAERWRDATDAFFRAGNWPD